MNDVEKARKFFDALAEELWGAARDHSEDAKSLDPDREIEQPLKILGFLASAIEVAIGKVVDEERPE